MNNENESNLINFVNKIIKSKLKEKDERIAELEQELARYKDQVQNITPSVNSIKSQGKTPESVPSVVFINSNPAKFEVLESQSSPKETSKNPVIELDFQEQKACQNESLKTIPYPSSTPSPPMVKPGDFDETPDIPLKSSQNQNESPSLNRALNSNKPKCYTKQHRTVNYKPSVKEETKVNSNEKPAPMCGIMLSSEASPFEESHDIPRLQSLIQSQSSEDNSFSNAHHQSLFNEDYTAEKEHSRQENYYKFNETVKKRSDRQKMHAFDCPCCSSYYRVTADLLEFNAHRSKQVSENENPNARQQMNENVKDLERRIQERKQQSSRHRSLNKKPKTPEGYWKLGFDGKVKSSKRARKM